MERKTRMWLGLGAAVLVSGTSIPSNAAVGDSSGEILARPRTVSPGASGALFQVAQADDAPVLEGGEGGEGEGGEGGGQILGTIVEFRLTSTDPNAFNYDASAPVATYGAVVYERYAALQQATVAMQDAIAALLEDPTDASLAAARDAWVAARIAYAPTEAYLFYAGPIDGLAAPLPRINSWPIDPAYLDYVEGVPDSGIVNDPSIALDRRNVVALNLAGDETHVTTGFHAIEFLLFGEDLSADGPGARPASDFAAGVGNNDRRRELLRVITQLLVNDITVVTAAWAPNANNYRATIVAMDQRNAIGRAFNGMAVLAGYELGLKRISATLRRGGDFEPSRFGDSTTAETVAALQGIRDVYFGSVSGFEGAVGFDTLVASIDPAINDRVVAAFDAAQAAVGALDAPYDSIGASADDSTARAEAEAAVDALRELAAALRAAGNRLGVLVLIPGI